MRKPRVTKSNGAFQREVDNFLVYSSDFSRDAIWNSSIASQVQPIILSIYSEPIV